MRWRGNAVWVWLLGLVLLFTVPPSADQKRNPLGTGSISYSVDTSNATAAVQDGSKFCFDGGSGTDVCFEFDAPTSRVILNDELEVTALYVAGAGAGKQTWCYLRENLASGDDAFEFFMPVAAATVTDVGCKCRGSCATPATLVFEDRAGNAMTHAALTCSTGTGNSTFIAVTAAGALAAGEGVAFNTTNAPTANDEYTICIAYTVN